MNTKADSPSSRRVYRVDKFAVPKSGRDEFIVRIRETHEFLRKQSGFVRDTLLEKQEDSDTFIIITIAVWEDQKAVDAAKAAMIAWRQTSGFDPQQLIRKLGIQADFGVYHDLA
jgi:heme-degrading monooxygenase HmoA